MEIMVITRHTWEGMSGENTAARSVIDGMK